MEGIVSTGGGQPRNVRQALDAARRASSPAETVQHLFIAIAYQQQQIEALEKAVGVQDASAMEDIRARGRQLLDEDPIRRRDLGL